MKRRGANDASLSSCQERTGVKVKLGVIFFSRGGGAWLRWFGFIFGKCCVNRVGAVGPERRSSF